MKYLESYQLFEAKNRQAITDEIVNALENTPEGKDLLGLAIKELSYSDGLDKTSRYTARRTGRVEINNLRGKTYITRLEDGKWYHAVEATGRTYGEGIYDSLTDCIRGVWVDFITNSTSIRPQGMNIKRFKKFVDQEINNLIGKNLNKLEIRKHLSKAYFGGEEPMNEDSPIFSSPRWKQIFDFIGLEKKTSFLRMQIVSGSFSEGFWHYSSNKKYSPLLQLADILLKTSSARGVEGASLYDLHFRNIPVTISFSEVPIKISVDDYRGGVQIHVGDTIEKSKEIETIAAKKFIELKSVAEDEYIDEKLPDIRKMQTYEILKVFVRFAMDIFAKGMEGEEEIEISDDIFFKSISPLIKEANPSPDILSKMREKFPRLWEFYINLDPEVNQGNEIIADLGDLGF